VSDERLLDRAPLALLVAAFVFALAYLAFEAWGQTPTPAANVISDPVKVALITSASAMLLGGATLFVSIRNGRRGAAMEEKLDGRLTQLLTVTSNVARALGLKEGEEIGHAKGLAEGEARAAARAAGQEAGMELTGRRPVEKP